MSLMYSLVDLERNLEHSTAIGGTPPASVVLPVLGDKAEPLLVRHEARSTCRSQKRLFAVPPSFFRSLRMSVLSRDLAAAKMAFEVGDAELSKKAHAARAAPEKHSGYLEVKPEHELPTASLTPHLGKQVNTFKLSSLADSMEVRAGTRCR